MAHGGVLTSLATLEGEVATTASDGVVICCDLWLFAGHQERAWNVAWNPTGTLLASCSADKTISSILLTP